MNRLPFYTLLLLIALTAFTIACNDDDDDNDPQVITGAGEYPGCTG
jgi:hypothetical protein